MDSTLKNKKPPDKGGILTGIPISNRYEVLGKETNVCPETAQITTNAVEWEPTDPQKVSAQSLVDENETLKTLPPPGLEEVEPKSTRAETHDIEAELSFSNTSNGDWSVEVDQSGECNMSSDREASDIPKVLDETFKDYSSDSDTDEIPKEPLQHISKKACMECEVKTPQAQEGNQEDKHHSPPSDGDGRLPVSVTPDAYSDQEVNTQQNKGVRDGMPPVPDVKISRPDDEKQNETPDDTKDFQTDTHDEQQDNSPCQRVQENPVTIKVWESNYETAAKGTTVPDEIQLGNLFSAIDEMAAIPKANLNDEPMKEVEMDQTVEHSQILKEKELQDEIEPERVAVLKKRDEDRARNAENTKRKEEKREKVYQDQPHKTIIIETAETVEEQGAAVLQHHNKTENPTENKIPTPLFEKFPSNQHI
ncbi:hypothetical protein JTB14_013681 [Gonioctena quinquepunctata]|nr:hypothetical protein JTB14_013681 [Gonioctena quinquepunctata]